jgi:DNA-binding transcriptional regulator GbsR (MarR family)
MSLANITLNLEQLSLYLAEKQNLSHKYKGINYSHSISIINNIVLFQDSESLYVRMRTFSPALLHSLVKNKHLTHAPFKSGKLAYVGKELLSSYYYMNLKENIEYKKPDTRAVLDFIKDQGTATRQKIMESFKLSKEEVMDILSELRMNFQIFMFYDGTTWTINHADILLNETPMSKASATTDLILKLIKSYGPITVPQIMHILQMSGGRVSTSIIELFENKKIIRGYFIENSSYEAFLAAEELEYLEEFLNKYSSESKKELEILPLTDPLAEYWASADFINLGEMHQEVLLVSGKPICSFDYKIIGDNLHIQNLTKSSEYPSFEDEAKTKIQEFSENKGKILIFPELQSEVLENQSRVFAKILTQRGYLSRSDGLVYHVSKFTKKEGSAKLISYSDVFELLMSIQSLTKTKLFSSKAEIVKGLSDLGIPLSTPSLLIRIETGKEHLLNEMIINRQLVSGKYGAFSRGIIASKDYKIFSKLSVTKKMGVLEEKTLNIIKQKEKVDFKQLKAAINLSDRVLLSTLLRLETAHEIVQSKSISNQTIWMPVSKYMSGIKAIEKASQREAWIDVLYRFLSSNLPLTINQIANITGLSNTQIEVYLKELIASKGVRSGRFIEEENEVQFTTKEIEELIAGYIFQRDELEEQKESISMIYVPRNDPLLTLYKTYLLRRFKLKSLFLRVLPSDYAELVLMNGIPVAALHFKKQEKIEYVNNIEILPEYNDSHSLMLIFSSIQEYLNKTKEKGKRQLRIKQINGVLLHSEAGRKYLSLIKDMKFDFLIQP